MAKRALAADSLLVAQAVASALPSGDLVIGCSGGADSTALALGAQWVTGRTGAHARVVIVDHGLQPGSAVVAGEAAGRLAGHGIDAEIVRVEVRPSGEGVEAAARTARLEALSARGLPVLLGHTLDDQAETVLLGLLRGSGTRSLAGMASVRGQFIRPLLGLRRAHTEAACRAWGITWWQDPMNDQSAFARVRARQLLDELKRSLGRDVAPALARSAILARADADALDALAETHLAGEEPSCAELGALPNAIRWRVLHRWLVDHGTSPGQGHVFAVDRLVCAWHGQGHVSVPGGAVARVDGRLVFGPVVGPDTSASGVGTG